MCIGCVPGVPLLLWQVPVAHLLHTGLFPAVCGDNAVAAEAVVALALLKVAAVAQGFAAQGVLLPESLIHIVPDEAALVHGEFLSQADITLHASQGVAHIVHIFTEQERLLRIVFQIFPDFRGSGVHPALHIGAVTPLFTPVAALVVDNPAGVLGPEKVRHVQNVLPAEALVAAGPEENGHMVLVPLEHGVGSVQHAVPPLRAAAGHIPAWLHAGAAQGILLPGAVGLHVGLVHHVNAVFVAQLVPFRPVGIVAGAHGVDVVGMKHFHGGVHVLLGNAAAAGGAPLVAVNAVQHKPLSVEQQKLVL